jgi:hypothetical protein
MGFLIKDSLKRSPYWIAVYKNADGIQRRKSTKCTDKLRAREFLRGLEAAEFLGATRSATEEQFRHLIREIATRMTGRNFSDPTIRDHLSRWLESEKGTVETSTLAQEENELLIGLLRSRAQAENGTTKGKTNWRRTGYLGGRAPGIAPFRRIF